MVETYQSNGTAIHDCNTFGHVYLTRMEPFTYADTATTNYVTEWRQVAVCQYCGKYL